MVSITNSVQFKLHNVLKQTLKKKKTPKKTKLCSVLKESEDILKQTTCFKTKKHMFKGSDNHSKVPMRIVNQKRTASIICCTWGGGGKP